MAAPTGRRRWRYAVALFILAPFVGEFLLGNTPVTAAPWGLLLAPMYGGGALLVREVGRRVGGWPTLIMFAGAYALLEEGPVDQMLFNPSYLGLDDFSQFAPLPGLGISVSLTVSSLVMHAVWSICVPIALVEAFDSGRSSQAEPWLGPVGLVVTTVIFIAGLALVALMNYEQHLFLASPLQLTAVSVLILGLIAGGVVVGCRGRQGPVMPGHPEPGTERVADDPSASGAPWLRWTGLVAFALSSVYWVIDILGPWFVGPWTVIVVKVALVGLTATTLASFSRRAGWGRRHRFAVAAGVLSTYVWVGFVHAGEMGFGVWIVVVGGVLCGLIAVVLVGLAARAEGRAAREQVLR